MAYTRCNMDKTEYLVAKTLHQNYRWFSLPDLHAQMVKDGLERDYKNVSWCAAKLYNVGYASKCRIGSMHGAVAFYKWHSHDLSEPEDYYDYWDPIPQDQISFEIQLRGEEKERYLWVKEKRDAYYCGNGDIEDEE